MGRGILTGVIWGAIVGFGILTLANAVVSPLERASEAPVEHAALPEGGSAPVRPEITAEDPQANPSPETPAMPAPAEGEMSAPVAPETPDATAPAMEVTAESPAAEPDRSGAQPDVAAPEAETEVLPTAEGAAARAPEVERPQGPQAPEAGEAMGEVAAPESSPVLTPPQAMAPEAGGSDSLPEAEESLPAPMPLPEGTSEAPQAPTMPETTPENRLDGAEMEAAPGAALEEGPESNPMPGRKVGSFTERADSRVSSRLPTIGGKAEDPQGEAQAPLVVAEDLPALLAYSADFDQTPSGPVMSIILVDIAKLSPGDAVLTHLPFSVTFAVDALATGAGDRAMAYRDNGSEVLSMISLPEGATPQDAAVTLAQAADLVPVSIGFLDVPSGTFQSSRQVAAQVVATAQESGRGLVSFPRGLNALEQEAQRAKAPAALVFRDFDGRGQDVDAMKRFLDQAAFQAGTGKTVVLLGRSKPDTIQALAEWSLGNRAARVTMVPLSYLLSRSPL